MIWLLMSLQGTDGHLLGDTAAGAMTEGGWGG